MTLTELARHPRLRRGLVIAAAAVAVWSVLGFLAVPPLVRSLLANTLTKSLHRRTTVGGVAFNPFALSVRVRGLTVHEPASDEVFVSLAEAYAKVSCFASSFETPDPSWKSRRAIRMHQIVRGTREMSEKKRPIVPTVGGTNISTLIRIPTYAVTLLKIVLRSMTAEMIRPTTPPRT